MSTTPPGARHLRSPAISKDEIANQSDEWLHKTIAANRDPDNPIRRMAERELRAREDRETNRGRDNVQKWILITLGATLVATVAGLFLK